MLKEKIKLVRLRSKTFLERAEKERAIRAELSKCPVLMMHSIAFLPPAVLSATPEKIQRLLLDREMDTIEELSVKQPALTFFDVGQEYFVDWIDLDTEAEFEGHPLTEQMEVLALRATKTVNKRLEKFLVRFVNYETWIKTLWVYIAEESVERFKFNKVRAKVTFAMLAHVEPSDIVKKVARTGMFSIVREGNFKRINTYVNTASLAKAKEYKKWLKDTGQVEAEEDLQFL